jgi:hypothetical protein
MYCKIVAQDLVRIKVLYIQNYITLKYVHSDNPTMLYQLATKFFSAQYCDQEI